MTPTPTQVLATEISHAVNSVSNAIACRRDHPSYGYTKKEILATFNRLEGLLQAYTIVTTGSASATASFDSFAAARDLGIDLVALDIRVRAA